jgi:hypothetical protein
MRVLELVLQLLSAVVLIRGGVPIQGFVGRSTEPIMSALTAQRRVIASVRGRDCEIGEDFRIFGMRSSLFAM